MFCASPAGSLGFYSSFYALRFLRRDSRAMRRRTRDAALYLRNAAPLAHFPCPLPLSFATLVSRFNVHAQPEQPFEVLLRLDDLS